MLYSRARALGFNKTSYCFCMEYQYNTFLYCNVLAGEFLMRQILVIRGSRYSLHYSGGAHLQPLQTALYQMIRSSLFGCFYLEMCSFLVLFCYQLK